MACPCFYSYFDSSKNMIDNLQVSHVYIKGPGAHIYKNQSKICDLKIVAEKTAEDQKLVVNNGKQLVIKSKISGTIKELIIKKNERVSVG